MSGIASDLQAANLGRRRAGRAHARRRLRDRRDRQRRRLRPASRPRRHPCDGPAIVRTRRSAPIARLLPPMARILVVEPVAEPGLELLAATDETTVRLGLSRADLLAALGADGGWDALVVRSQTRVDAELLEAAAPRLERRRRGERRHRPDRYPGGDPRRRDGRQRPNGKHDRRRRAHHGAHARAAAPRGSRQRVARRRRVGSGLASPATSCVGEPSASSASGRSGERSRAAPVRFEMRVVANDPYLTEEQAAEHGARLVGLPELLTRADVITVHTPLTAQTRGLLGRAQLEATRPGAFVLNVARGGIVDETALAEALRSGHLAGAAVDVYSAEPMAPDNPLRGAPNLAADPAPRRVDERGAGPRRARDGRAGRDGARRRDAAVRDQRPGGRRRYGTSAAAVRRAWRAPGDPGAPAGTRRIRCVRAHLCRRDRRRRMRADPHRRRRRHARGGHRPARQRRERGPRRAGARTHRARGANRRIGAVGVARRARVGPVGDRPSLRAGRLDRARTAAPGRASTTSRSTPSWPAPRW